MKKPEKILEAFKTLSDEAAREVADLRAGRDRALRDQVETLRGIEVGFNDARRERQAAQAAVGFARRSMMQAAALRKYAEQLAEQEVDARDKLLDRFADQKRFEVYLSQRQLKEKALARKREEKNLLEQIDQLARPDGDAEESQ